MDSELDEVTLSEVAVFSSHRHGEAAARLRAMSEFLRTKGYTWFRATRVPGDSGIWMEGWKVRPRDEGAFNRQHAEKVKIDYAGTATKV